MSNSGVVKETQVLPKHESSIDTSKNLERQYLLTWGKYIYNRLDIYSSRSYQ